MRFFFREQRKPEIKEVPKTERQLLLEDLEKTKCELDTAYRGFDYVTDPDLIDCYIYDINATLNHWWSQIMLSYDFMKTKRFDHILENILLCGLPKKQKNILYKDTEK